MVLQRGTRVKLSQFMDDGRGAVLRLRAAGPAIYDCTCFGTDASGKLAGDAYMTFYNQPATPCGGVRWSEVPGGVDFALDLSRLPAGIAKLAFTVSIDGAGTMGQASSCSFELVQDGTVKAECVLSGSDFKSEEAVIALEIYRKPDWRACAVMRGFNGGLGDLLRYYGGEEASTAPAQPRVSPPVQRQVQPPATPSGHKVDLEKKLAKAPGLVSLAKPLKVSLEKHKLTDVTARVALVMDISGSMSERYSNGTVQSVVDKAMPLAAQFDDDGNLDFWYYGSKCRKMDDVTLDNYRSAVPANWQKLMRSLGYGNNEPVVMQEVINFYADTELPVYVFFVTDGGVGNEHKISTLMRKASEKPIFWQFVGIGGCNYGVLERLDTMGGRRVDNAGFFSLDDFKTVPDRELYDRLLSEFPSWLEAARRAGVI